MRHLKTYEENKNTTAKNFKPGDVVKIINKNYKKEINDFLYNNIGEIYNIEYNQNDQDYYFYNVRYTNVPNTLYNFTRYMGTFPMGDLKSQGEIFTANDDELRLATPEEIEHHKIKINADKYNL